MSGASPDAGSCRERLETLPAPATCRFALFKQLILLW